MLSEGFPWAFLKGSLQTGKRLLKERYKIYFIASVLQLADEKAYFRYKQNVV